MFRKAWFERITLFLDKLLLFTETGGGDSDMA